MPICDLQPGSLTACYNLLVLVCRHGTCTARTIAFSVTDPVFCVVHYRFLIGTFDDCAFTFSYLRAASIWSLKMARDRSCNVCLSRFTWSQVGPCGNILSLPPSLSPSLSLPLSLSVCLCVCRAPSNLHANQASMHDSLSYGIHMFQRAAVV